MNSAQLLIIIECLGKLNITLDSLILDKYFHIIFKKTIDKMFLILNNDEKEKYITAFSYSTVPVRACPVRSRLVSRR